MEFKTDVELPFGEAEIRHSDRIMLWGSCFAENIGRLLGENKFTCDVNPFGVLYNPLSIAKAVTLLRSSRLFTRDDLRYEHGTWYSLMHHSSFSASDVNDCLTKINHRLKEGSNHLATADWLLLTWGTAWVYEWAENGEIVGNCHKLPERMFKRRRLEADEIVKVYTELITRLRNENPKLKILFTVSPIRHAKDGMHANQLSKATLLLAADRICATLPACYYFPSYEIVIDELRDYRFYADDMLHLTPLAVQYIWQQFGKTYFPAATHQVMKQWEEISKALSHRPFNPESEKYRIFLSQILLKIERIKEKFPYLDVQNEEMICQARLKK